MAEPKSRMTAVVAFILFLFSLLRALIFFIDNFFIDNFCSHLLGGELVSDLKNLMVNFLVLVAKVKEFSAMFENIVLCFGFEARVSKVTNVLGEEVPARSGPEAEFLPGDVQSLKNSA